MTHQSIIGPCCGTQTAELTCRRCARIYLREARLRAGIPAQRGFTFTLLEWAGNARQRAMQAARTQIQGSLF